MIVNPQLTKNRMNCNNICFAGSKNGLELDSACNISKVKQERLTSLPSTKLFLLNKFSNISFKGVQEDSIVDKKARIFMGKLGESFSDRKKCFVVVSHVVPNATPFLDTLSEYGRITGVIAKPNSIQQNTYKAYEKKGIDFLNIKKQDLFSPGIIQEKIAPLIKKDEDLIIVDVGGYFAGSLEQLNKLDNLIGIVEDTENGLQKYEKALKNCSNNKVPIYSVARSKSKDFEDYLVGRSIASATLDVLKKNKIKYQDKKIGIIGFGEVGRGAAIHLKDNINCDVQIFDKSKKVQELVSQNGLRTVSKKKLLETSDILICATGNKSLSDTDLSKIKKGCYISSCTSADDEFDFKNIKISDGDIVGDKLKKVEEVIFLNDGNAINFINPIKHGGIIEPYIHLTNSAILNCCTKLDNEQATKFNEINELNSKEEENLISSFHEFMPTDNKKIQFLKEVHSISTK